MSKITGVFSSYCKGFRRAVCSLLFLGVFVAASSHAVEKVFYRYTNDKGVRVINHSIPPEYAQKGYEVVDLYGHVIKEVPPAVAPEDAARVEAEREEQERLAAWDRDLRRRYSDVKDIEFAKERRLRDLETNLSILRSNILNLQSQVRAEQSRAADLERKGRNVPNSVLTKISNLSAELEDANSQVQVRLRDYDLVAQQYDRDIARFEEIQAQANP